MALGPLNGPRSGILCLGSTSFTCRSLGGPFAEEKDNENVNLHMNACQHTEICVNGRALRIEYYAIITYISSVRPISQKSTSQTYNQPY